MNDSATERPLSWWRADFKDRAVRKVSIRRSEWDDHRDLRVEVRAAGKEDARDKVFDLARRAGLKDPFLGVLEPGRLDKEPSPVTEHPLSTEAIQASLDDPITVPGECICAWGRELPHRLVIRQPNPDCTVHSPDDPIDVERDRD